MNRCFRNKEFDGVEGRTAQDLKPILDKVDALLDVHSSISSDGVSFCVCGEHSVEVAKVLPVERVLFGLDSFVMGGTEYYMNSQKKVGICIECGTRGSEDAINTAVEAIYSFLSYYGLVDVENKVRKPQLFFAESMYRNKKDFKLAGEFSDFEKIKEKTLVGYDGDKEVFINDGKFILFPDEPKEKNGECFTVLKKLN